MPNKYFAAEDHLIYDGDTADQEDINAPLRALETAFDVVNTDIDSMSATLINYEDAAASAAAALASAAAASGSAATATSAAATATGAKDTALQAEADTMSIFGDAQAVADAVALSTANAAATANDVLDTAANVLLTAADASSTADDVLSTAADRAAVEAVLSGANLDGKADKSGTLAQFAATTSLQLKGVISDETGSGALVFANSPQLVTPDIGTASGVSFNSITGLSSSPPQECGSLAAVGTSTAAARADHRHPSDSTKANLASPALTGVPTTPTPATSDDSTKIANTAFVNNRLDADFVMSNSANGYWKGRDGFVIQWGTVVSSGTPQGTTTHSFPTAFTNVRGISLTVFGGLSKVGYTALTNTGFTIMCEHASVTIGWQAVGYIA